MDSDAERYERHVLVHGLSRTHNRVLDWVPDGSRVLELGCATGYIGSLLMEHRHCEVVGVELDSAAAQTAEERGLTVVVGSLEDEGIRRSIPGPFDVVIATDVLEHLRDPRVVLDEMKSWVRPFGRAIVAVPNVAAWTMRARLLLGDFEYQETGLLDHTHLRFFTWNTFHELVLGLGWQVEDTFADAWELPLLQTAMMELPLALRDKLEGQMGGAGIRSRLVEQLYHFLGRTIQRREAWAEKLGPYRPNLCASHVALLLRPPVSA